MHRGRCRHHGLRRRPWPPLVAGTRGGDHSARPCRAPLVTARCGICQAARVVEKRAAFEAIYRHLRAGPEERLRAVTADLADASGR